MIRKFSVQQKFIRKNLMRAYSQSKSESISYYHRSESQPSKYITVGELLQSSVKTFGDSISLVAYNEHKVLTFREALNKADRLASSLLNIGLEKGDRVAIWSPNYAFWYVTQMAIARAGLICVTLNPAYTVHELVYCLENVDVKAVIAPEVFKTQKYYEMLLNVRKSLSASAMSLKHIIIYGEKKLRDAYKFDELLRSSENDLIKIEHLQPTISPDSGCMIQFTSGTTGKPKATLLSHFGMVNNSYSIGLRNGLNKSKAKVCVQLPMFHVGGSIISSLGSLHHGFAIVFPSPYYDPTLMLKSIKDEKCNAIFGTPTFCIDLIAKQKSLNFELPQIDLVCLGGADISPQLVKDLTVVLKTKKVVSVYGMTETSSAIFQTLPEDSNESVEEFVGVVGNNVEAKVIDKEGNIVLIGQPGELCIKSRVNMIKYWNEEKNKSETFGKDKWLRTGDQFILYENGYGKICGRIKDMIIRGGENIFPKEIEDLLNTHENILESQVVGIPDERMGEEVCAFCRLKDESKHLKSSDVKKFCKGKIAHFKIPKYTVIVEEFPRTQSGKIQKYLIIDKFKDKLENLE